MEEPFPVQSVVRSYKEDRPPLRDRLQKADRRVWGWCEKGASLRGRESGSRETSTVESIESCICEKWEVGSWGREQFGNSEERETSAFEATTKQRLVKTEKSLYVL
jgi:hypothetical protein